MTRRGTLARQAAEWQPESSEQDMLRLLHLLRDVACGLKLLKSQSVVHADLVRRGLPLRCCQRFPVGLVWLSWLIILNYCHAVRHAVRL